MTGRYPTTSRSDRDLELIRATGSSPRAWFDAIARLHIAEIHHGVLPLFGPAFLARVYRGLAASTDAAVWVAVASDQPVAFIAGAFDERWFGRVIRRNVLALGALALPHLRWSTLRKSIAVFRYQRRLDGGSGTEAELLAIAVGPEAKRRGIGSQLTALLEDELRAQGISRYKVTTNAVEEESNAFYGARGFERIGTMPHHDLTLNVYEKSI